MEVARTVVDVRSALARAARPVGFVPTMGALHDGHLSLVERARERVATVVVSIFVNPLQFGPSEDFARYPRSEGQDFERAADAGVDIVFAPNGEEMYPAGHATTVSVAGVSEPYEGARRPGHFDGVATVVAKLFEIVDPDLAFFGQKDAQQVAVVRKMVCDLDMPVEIVACPTIREPDGLALSSRNVYLDPADRLAAPCLFRALQTGAAAITSGDTPEAAVQAMTAVLQAEPRIEIDYAAAVDPGSFAAPDPAGPVLLIVAARVGRTRLIDNLLVETTS
ncbi:MAG TPA: pantoate--beta-alanine ligase [Actinomycetota bacterium]|nr:pantoate--beta-alanine ligase [Actinomycetota bacterium]